MTPVMISVCFGIFILLLTLVLFSKNPTEQNLIDKQQEPRPNELLYTNFFEKLYDAIFGDKNPDHIAKKLGLEYDKYMLNCQIADHEPNLKKETMERVIGLIGFSVCMILALVFWNVIPFISGIAIYYLFITKYTQKAKKMADEKKEQVILDLPRFVDLLHSALDVGLPIDLAIETTAKNVPGTISDDIKMSLAKMQLGASSWQGALESLAHKYEINILSDFVLDIITAYNKGISISDAVAREAIEIRQSAVLAAKERTAKMSTTILAPLAVFKILPLLIIMMLPVVLEILKTMS